MYKLKNLNELGTTTLRRKALHIAEAGLEAIDTSRAIRKAVEVPSPNHVIIAGVPWRTDKKGKSQNYQAYPAKDGLSSRLKRQFLF